MKSFREIESVGEKKGRIHLLPVQYEDMKALSLKWVHIC